MKAIGKKYGTIIYETRLGCSHCFLKHFASGCHSSSGQVDESFNDYF